MPTDPSAARVSEELIHGVSIRDPYRWLENRRLRESDEWINEQRQLCDRYFSNCPGTTMLQSRIEQYLDVDIVDQVTQAGTKYFFRRRNRGDEQAGIYVLDSVNGREQLLTCVPKDSPYKSVRIHRVSRDVSLLAYEVREGGSDKMAIKVVDVESSRTLPMSLSPGYLGGFAFGSEHGSFYYAHDIPSDSSRHTIRFHAGKRVSADQVLLALPRSRMSRLILTSDGEHLGAMWLRSHGSELVGTFFLARRDDPTNWKPLFADKLSPPIPFLAHGRIFILRYGQTPNGSVVELSIDGVETQTIVPEGDLMIQQLAVVGQHAYVRYLSGKTPSVAYWSLTERSTGTIEVPSDGTVQFLPIVCDMQDHLFLVSESFMRPPTIFEYFPNSRSSRLYYSRKSPAKVNSCVVQDLSIQSMDGTAVPVLLLSRSDRHEGGPRPTIMTAYGGFGIPMTPYFSALVSIMVELGAVFVMAQIRGGGEVGGAWHEAARGRNRKNAFADFLSVAEWLCANDFTSPDKLAIFGGSNAGLLVGVSITQCPELFRAALCIAPLLDMVRYENFDRAAKWRQEYGTVQDREEFSALLEYSPYHNIRDGVDYPATLFVTGDKDDRCNPAHVRKMAARMQANPAQQRHILVDYTYERGHFPALPLSARCSSLLRRIAFLCCELKINLPDGEAL